MNKESILFLTKDALVQEYLPCYGNVFWKGKTPNLDELAKKGIVFENAFTAAPSSAMSYLTMFTRKYPYQQEIQTYVPLVKPYDGRTLFDEAFDMGYDCHVVWDEHWIKLAQRYSECYGKNTTMHPLRGLRQGVGPNYKRETPLARNKSVEDQTYDMFAKEIESIVASDKKVFLWCHLPHVLNGRISYGDDIDLFDRYIGCLRQFFSDDKIYISSDHGNMNGHRGKLRYGFDVYDTAIRIPLITPRIIENVDVWEGNFCNIDVFELLFSKKVIEREIIFSDCAYYAQPRRKLAVVYKNYRYIYNKENHSEELYDVEWDPQQEFNLISDTYYDVDRKIESPACELYFYPHWDKLQDIREKLRKQKDNIWRELTRKQKAVIGVKEFVKRQKWLKPLYQAVIRKTKSVQKRNV